MKFLIINGPNLNLLGMREPEIYGNQRFEDYVEQLRSHHSDWEIDYFQSNIEGEIIDRLHAAINGVEGIVINAGAYTHTSIGIGDAIAAIDVPCVEVHISNIFSREQDRHISKMGANCVAVIAGMGLAGYQMGLKFLADNAKNT